MARDKYWDEESQTWKYADQPGGGANDSGACPAVRTVLWSGTAAEGAAITLSADAADYDRIELVVDCAGANITGAKLIGGVADRDYYGESIAASAVVMGSGGYPYLCYASITKTGDGWQISHARCNKFATSGIQDAGIGCTVQQIVGYRWR